MSTRGVSIPGALVDRGIAAQSTSMPTCFPLRDAAVVQICKHLSGGLARRLHYSAPGLILIDLFVV